MKQHMWKFLVILGLVAFVGGLALMTSLPSAADTYPVELEGTIESMPTDTLYGQWQVAGVPVHVDTGTFVGGRMGTPSVGAWVKVQGAPDGNGGIAASRVKVDEMKAFAELEGRLEALEATSLTVAGIQFTRDANTFIVGTPVVGAHVKVFYTPQQDGSLLAAQVRAANLQYVPGTPPGAPTPPSTPTPGIFVKFHGIIESMPTGRVGIWNISGRNVEVTAYTVVDEHKGIAQVGAPIEVKGIVQPDGTILASEIEVERYARGGSGSGGQVGPYIKFYGVIESLPNNGYVGTWVVSGRNVEVTMATFIEMEDGVPAVGVRVEVKGYVQSDNSILADKIEIEGSEGPGDPSDGDDDHPGQGTLIKFYGQVQSMPANGLIGTWSISGRTVHTSAQTRFKQEHGPFQVGAWVEVKGYRQPDGSINATEMETKDRDDDDLSLPRGIGRVDK